MTTHQRRRAERVLTARQRGTHTRAEWQAILLAANGVCARCGQRHALTKDHVHPLYLGGDDSADNLQAICQRCNTARGPHSGRETFADRVRTLRDGLGETTTVFGARFLRSARTVEDWEQGRRFLDRLGLVQFDRLERWHARRERRRLSPRRPTTTKKRRPTSTTRYKDPRADVPSRSLLPSRRTDTRVEYEISPGRWVSRQRVSQLRRAGQFPFVPPLINPAEHLGLDNTAKP